MALKEGRKERMHVNSIGTQPFSFKHTHTYTHTFIHTHSRFVWADDVMLIRGTGSVTVCEECWSALKMKPEAILSLIEEHHVTTNTAHTPMSFGGLQPLSRGLGSPQRSGPPDSI